MEQMTCSLTGERRWVDCGYCAGFDSVVICQGCPMWVSETTQNLAYRAATWKWLKALVLRFWPILLVFTAVFALLGLSAKPTMAAHDPTHCSAEFARAVGRGAYGNRYFFSGNWIVAAGGGMICFLQSVGSGVFNEVSTFPLKSEEYLLKAAAAKKAVETTGKVIAGVVKKVVPRGPMIVVFTYAICQQFADNHLWMERDYHANCGGTQNW